MPDTESLKVFMEGKFDVINTKLDTINTKIGEHHKELYGEDSDTPGVKLKVDRLEQAKKNTEKHLGVAWAAAVGLIIKSIWDIFTGHK